MPSDFSVDDDGSVRLISPYINNLHPGKHEPLYRVIETTLAGFIPMFERVLGDLKSHKEPCAGSRIKTTPGFGNWAAHEDMYWGERLDCIWGKGEEPSPKGKPPPGVDRDTFYADFLAKAPKILPESFETYSGALEKAFSPYSLRGRQIQCIVKLANVKLSPENPEYTGGSWHIEGMQNESIVASGIYYYDEHNITESSLEFRVTTAPPTYHRQDDELCMEILYGMIRDNPCIQDLGKMVTKEGRGLAWPNIYQHRVSGFRLLDPSKPGHRKILVFFLVDPSIDPIPSATNIPPQQAEWALEALDAANNDPSSYLSSLPPELCDLIKEKYPNTLMTRIEAEAYRLQLMGERTVFTKKHRKTVVEQTFNMCEH